MVGSSCFLGYFNCFSGRVGLLRALLSQRGKGDEVALVAEAPVDVPLYPLLRLPRLVAVPQRCHKDMLHLIQRRYRDLVVLLRVLPACVPGCGTAVPFADLQLLDAAVGPLSPFRAAAALLFVVASAALASFAAVSAALASFATVSAQPAVGVVPSVAMVPGGETPSPHSEPLLHRWAPGVVAPFWLLPLPGSWSVGVHH